MKISFLVTFYNQEQYVKKNLDSILSIDIPCDWEILVGDDGSSDGTLNIVNAYMEKYPENIKLFTIPRDKYVEYDSVSRASLNRLNLLSNCSGDYFCLVDGDDYYIDKAFIQESIEAFSTNSNISVVSFDYCYLINGKIRNRSNLNGSFNNEIIDKHTYLRKLYYHSGSCVYKVAWDSSRINYIRELGYFDDNDIVINSLNFGEMFHVDRPIYVYRQTGKSIYTSMDDLKKALLNVSGFDVDAKLIDSIYRNDLVIRYSYSILWLYYYICAKSRLIPENYLSRYDSILKIESSLLYGLMFYDSPDQSAREYVDDIIVYIQKNDFITYLKVTLKMHFMNRFFSRR